MPGSVIVGSARTPIGKLSGALAGFSAPDLGGLAIKAALERAGVGAEQVDYVLMGQVLQAGQGQITARQAAVKAGIPMTVPAMTVNKVCLSGINAIYLADQMIQNGDAEVVVAGGMESMTQRAVPPAGRACGLPHGQQRGRRLADQRRPVVRVRRGAHGRGHRELRRPGRRHHARGAGRGRGASRTSAPPPPRRKAASPTRSRRSRSRSARATRSIVDTDEGVRPGTTTESLGGLRPAFSKDGTITAGNASQISDGGAAVIMTSKAKAEELGATPLAELIGYGMVAGPDPSLLTQPSRSIKRALEADDMTVKDVDLFELNEAFAAVGIASMKDLGITDDIVNVNGGAIALGHPVGMSGTRVVLTLINELRRRGGGVGAAALCGGGGQGDAAIIRTL